MCCEMRAVYRILDAAANRASEGMRTIDQWLRFGLNDAALTESSKQIRHDFAAALAQIDRRSLLHARDTDGDVGTSLGTESEYQRANVRDVLTAASGRVQQSLRVLEEYGKTIDTGFAKQIEQIRYRTYTLYREIELLTRPSDRATRLQNAQLYLLLDCRCSGDDFAEYVESLADAGVDVFQLRDKSATDRTLFERARMGTQIANRNGSLFIVNDRVDIAAAALADGVHVGQDELPVPAAREILGVDRLIGVSTHNMDQVRQAFQCGADYLGCGPTFPSTTKQFSDHAGTVFLEQVCQSTQLAARPAFAIGGIGPNNVDQVIATGFRRIAVTAAINQSADPIASAKQLRRALGDLK